MAKVLPLSFENFPIHSFTHLRGTECVKAHLWSAKENLCSQFFPSTVQAPGTELRSWDLAANTLLALPPFFLPPPLTVSVKCPSQTQLQSSANGALVREGEIFSVGTGGGSPGLQAVLACALPRCLALLWLQCSPLPKVAPGRRNPFSLQLLFVRIWSKQWET